MPPALEARSLNHSNAKEVPRVQPCDVVYPTDLDKCIMACRHLYNNIQRHFSALQIICALPIHPSLPYICFLSLYHEYFLVSLKATHIYSHTSYHEEGDEDPEIDYSLNYTFNKAQKRVVNIALSNTFGFGGHNASLIVKKFVK